MDKWHLIGWRSEWNNYQFIVIKKNQCLKRMVEWHKTGKGRKMTGRNYGEGSVTFTAGLIQVVNMGYLTGEAVR